MPFRNITIGTIDEIADNARANVGEGRIVTSRWRSGYLKIDVPKNRVIINDPNSNTMAMGAQEFLRYVDEVLQRQGLLLTEACYRPGHPDGWRPHRLEGTFYRV